MSSKQVQTTSQHVSVPYGSMTNRLFLLKYSCELLSLWVMQSFLSVQYSLVEWGSFNQDLEQGLDFVRKFGYPKKALLIFPITMCNKLGKTLCTIRESHEQRAEVLTQRNARRLQEVLLCGCVTFGKMTLNGQISIVINYGNMVITKWANVWQTMEVNGPWRHRPQG